MKKLIIITITILFTTFILIKAHAQTNSTLDKFSNTTWGWTNGTDSLKIYLKKTTGSIPNSTIEPFDVLMGFHYYKQGNSIIESAYNYKNTSHSEGNWTILLGNEQGNNGNNLEGTIRHISKNKTIRLKFSVDATGTKAFLSLKNTEGVKIAPYDSTISLPNNITLYKMTHEPRRPTGPVRGN